MAGVDQDKDVLLTLLLKPRGNKRRMFLALAVVVIALTGMLLDLFWMPWESAGSRMVPFLWLVAVCSCCAGGVGYLYRGVVGLGDSGAEDGEAVEG